MSVQHDIQPILLRYSDSCFIKQLGYVRSAIMDQMRVPMAVTHTSVNLRLSPPTTPPDFDYLAKRGDWAPVIGDRVCVKSVAYEEPPWIGQVKYIEQVKYEQVDYEQMEYVETGSDRYVYCVVQDPGREHTTTRWLRLAELEQPVSSMLADRHAR